MKGWIYEGWSARHFAGKSHFANLIELFEVVMKMIDKNRAVDLARSLNARMNQKIEAKRIHGDMVGSIQSCLAHRR